MPEYDLLFTIVGGVVTASILGYVAQRLKLSALVGYLLAGMLIGPYTPGFVADVAMAKQLAEVGIILLMFGVGLHFSLQDLFAVRRVALPGALFQMAVAITLGTVVGRLAGFSLSASLLYGLTLSVASTVVLLRALEENHLLHTPAGKIAVGWLIVEDVVMVLAIVLLPLLAGMANGEETVSLPRIAGEVIVLLLKVGAFVTFMLLFGRRFLPPLLRRVMETRSDELVTLCTLSVALGVAALAHNAFDASFALGAFFAGLVLSESRLGKQATDSTQALRDTFAVLFFVSVGMLFNPSTLLEQPLLVLITLAVIILGKGLAAYIFARLLRQEGKTRLTVALSLAQIGEFSFILAGMGMTFEALPKDLYDLILAGALLSIGLNPLWFRLTRMQTRATPYQRKLTENHGDIKV